MTLVMLCTPRKVAFLVATIANTVGGKKLSVVPTRDPIAKFSTLLVLQQREPTRVSDLFKWDIHSLSPHLYTKGFSLNFFCL